jgi:hypothetical protein
VGGYFSASNLRAIADRSKEIPKPVMISLFANKARRRSYALKITFKSA